MASFPLGLSFRVLLHDSREISSEGLGEKKNIPRRALNLAFIHGCSSTTWLKILATNIRMRNGTGFNPKIWKTGEITFLRFLLFYA